MFRLVPLLLLICMTLPLQAAGAPETRQQLEEVRGRIRQTEAELDQRRRQARELVQKLHASEAALGRTRQALERIRGQLDRLKKEIAEQEQKADEAGQRLDRTGRALRQRLTAIYKGGESTFLKVLLSNSSPADMARDYDFFRRIVQRDRELLVRYREEQLHARAQKARLERLRAEQEKAFAERKSQQQRLDKQRQQQQRLLAQVRQDEEALAVLLHELEDKARRLNDLLGDVRREPAKGSQAATGFAGSRGRLPWPVNGPVRVGFGTGRHPVLGTRYESHGIEIVVNGEKPIRAVWDGRVIFAKPFRGYGNLMILDHGDGYYTLYAQASRLLRKPGERVHKGDRIAVSGYEGSDVVYFEIRKGSRPVDPMRWLASRRR
ncbi:MAG: peptidoglycan DD-metalloendopeptidase family protein [Geothermobacteraceae bacterium]